MVTAATSVKKFEIWLADLDPATGSEMAKTRPVLIVSPNELNQAIRTVIIAPLTSRLRKYPTRITLNFQDIKGQVAFDQIRSIDKSRLIKKLGGILKSDQENARRVLLDLFN